METLTIITFVAVNDSTGLSLHQQLGLIVGVNESLVWALPPAAVIDRPIMVWPVGRPANLIWVDSRYRAVTILHDCYRLDRASASNATNSATCFSHKDHPSKYDAHAGNNDRTQYLFHT